MVKELLSEGHELKTNDLEIHKYGETERETRANLNDIVSGILPEIKRKLNIV